MVNPSKIRKEITPVKLQEPTVSQIIQQARSKGMTVGGNFPLASGTRYLVAFFDIDEEITPSGLQSQFETIKEVNNAYYVGEHTTGENLPNRQWEVNLRIKVRETGVPIEIVQEPEPEIEIEPEA